MRSKTRFYIEAALASVTGFLGILTIFWRDWIEGVTGGWDPDHHSGSVEWAIVAGLLVVSVVFALIARVEWRRLNAAPAAS